MEEERDQRMEEDAPMGSDHEEEKAEEDEEGDFVYVDDNEMD